MKLDLLLSLTFSSEKFNNFIYNIVDTNASHAHYPAMLTDMDLSADTRFHVYECDMRVDKLTRCWVYIRIEQLALCNVEKSSRRCPRLFIDLYHLVLQHAFISICSLKILRFRPLAIHYIAVSILSISQCRVFSLIDSRKGNTFDGITDQKLLNIYYSMQLTKTLRNIP